MSTHRFRFAHNKPKQRCPSCNERTLRTYVDTKTGEECSYEFGACDRINACNYHVAPSGVPVPDGKSRYIPTPKMKRTDWRCPPEIVAMTSNSAGNVFGKWLVSALGHKAAEALRMYRVGTYPMNGRVAALRGAAIWWQVGLDGLHRSGKVMAYKENGRRNKDVPSDWMHRLVYNKKSEELGLQQCWFGTHLLAERPDDPVALVESEKTAVIASCFYPGHIWIATGGFNLLLAEHAMCLSGRDVTIFPDKGAFSDKVAVNPRSGKETVVAGWSSKSQSIGLDVMCNSLTVSDILEAMGEVSDGSDIADGLMYPDDKGYFNYFESTGIDLFPQQHSCKIAFLPDGRPIGHSFKPSVRTVDIPTHIVESYSIEPKPVTSPIDRLVASNPAIGGLVKELDLDLSKATLKPLQ